MTTIPPEGIAAAGRAMFEHATQTSRMSRDDWGNLTPGSRRYWCDLARAALPHIEAAIADRIETWAAEHKRAGNTQHDNALSMAASLIRNGEKNWPGTGDPR